MKSRLSKKTLHAEAAKTVRTNPLPIKLQGEKNVQTAKPAPGQA